MKEQIDGFPIVAYEAALRGDFKNAVIASTPGGIEAQEKRGQRELVNNSTLPKQAPWEQLEKLGFVKGKDVDELFVECQMPPGWSKRGTDHSMHSELLDHKGRVRAGIFYKAAFYDRRADISRLDRRYGVSALRFKADGTRYDFDTDRYEDMAYSYQGVIDASTKDFLFTSSTKVSKGDPNRWKLEDAATKECVDWLAANYPNYQDPLAYWD